MGVGLLRLSGLEKDCTTCPDGARKRSKAKR